MNPIKLNVKYMMQNDSDTWQGYRMCQSSTVAMMVEFLRPDILGGKGKQEDDEYLGLVNMRGDTTIGKLHELTLKALGFTSAKFRTDLLEAHIHSQLEKNIPVGVGVWIRGHITSNLAVTGGGGHYVLIVGRTENGDFIIHDPNGELDLVNGRYKNYTNGAYNIWKRDHFMKRWTNSTSAQARGWGHIVNKGPQPDQKDVPTDTPRFVKVKSVIGGKEYTAYIIVDGDKNDGYILARAAGAYWDGETRTLRKD